MKFWLLQRGKITHKVPKGINSPIHIDFDYMGSAEYEFGAIPACLYRIDKQFDKYKFFKTELVSNVDANNMYIFCKEEDADDIKESLKDFVKKPKALKEPSYLDDVFGNSESIFRHCREKSDCWLDLQNNWIGFVGDDKTFQEFAEYMNYRHDTYRKLPKEDIKNLEDLIRRGW